MIDHSIQVHFQVKIALFVPFQNLLINVINDRIHLSIKNRLKLKNVTKKPIKNFNFFK